MVLLPPHELTNTIKRRMGKPRSEREVRFWPEPGKIRIPARAKAQSQPECRKDFGTMPAAFAGGVVLTETVNVTGAVALTFSLAGSEH